MTDTRTERYPVWESVILPSQYGQPDMYALGADGVRVDFADGTTALDGLSGLWNTNLGYGNKAIASAISEAATSASYLSLFRGGHRFAENAARALLDVAGPEQFGRVLFSTAGGAANDVMMKMVRQYQALRGETDRNLFVSMTGSWHGLTYGGFALTGLPLGQEMYGVDKRAMRHVSHQDETELVELLAREGDKVAAVVVEPVLGTGAYPVSERLIGALKELRDKYGFLLVIDEIATGFGRTGSFFASQAWPVLPDLMVTSKGLTNGTCAAAAVLVSHDICEVFEREDASLFHGETQAGTPASCAAIMAMISEMERLDACTAAQKLSLQLDGLLDDLATHPTVVEHRGAGCFRSVQLTGPAYDFAAAARRRGVLVQPHTDFFLVVPALTYTAADFEELGAALRGALDDVAG